MKRLLFAFLLLLLLLPALQTWLRVLPEPKLGGAYEAAPYPAFSTAELLNSTYQPAIEKYMKDSLGFRPWFIQVRNQLAFSLFQVSHYSYSIIGQQGMIFQDAPINAFLGKDLLSEDEIKVRVQRLRRVQQDLAERGIPLLFVMAPSKPRFLPELLPPHLAKPAPGQSNYEGFMAEMQRQNIELLNYTPLFASWKDTARYPLFPWGGTHWSAYGATLAADTLLNRVEALVKAPVPRLRTTGPPRITVDSAQSLDEDLSRPMNLLRPLKGYAAVYPQLGPAPARPGEKRPNLLLVGDSFGWGLMFYSPFIQHPFAPETRFWYYNKTVYLPDTFEHQEPNVDRAQLDLKQQVESRDIVMILLTDHNLTSNEFGFTSQLLDLYHPLTDADNARINELLKEITSKATWEEGSDPEFTERARQQARSLFDKERWK